MPVSCRVGVTGALSMKALVWTAVTKASPGVSAPLRKQWEGRGLKSFREPLSVELPTGVS